VDESIVHWYGLGGDWINMGLPHYIAIDRKPENGCKMQDTACGISGVIAKLKLVKSADYEGANNHGASAGDDDLPHGGKVLQEVVPTWSNSNRIVCADSYFASVAAALELKRIGLKFIGVVKTATKQFPLAYLSGLELRARGDRVGVGDHDVDLQPIMMAFVFMDRDRHYFISTTSSLLPGTTTRRTRWRQDDEAPNADPTRVELEIPQPLACEIYFSACGKIDQHNRVRQDDLGLEKKFGTLEWRLYQS
jgi:hypothetical protein